MNRKLAALMLAAVLGAGTVAGCGAGGADTKTASISASSEAETEAVSASSEAEAEAVSSSSEDGQEAEKASVDAGASEGEAPIEDGTYIADFSTDSTMFHLNEMSEGKGILTVKDNEMTIHITLVSKSIVNLYPGPSEEAKKEGAVLIEPTVDSVTYHDGTTDDVYGFDVPVPALDEDFTVSIIGTHGNWYDHVVSVTNPEPYTGE